MARSNHKLLAASLVAAGTLLAASACSGGGDTTVDASPTATTTTLADTTVTTTTNPAPSLTTLVGPAGAYGDAVEAVVPLGLHEFGQPGPPGPIFLSSGAGSLWVSHHRSHSVTRVDPTVGEPIAHIGIGQSGCRRRCAPSPGDTATVDMGAAWAGAAHGSGALLATDDAVWVLDIDGFAWVIDPATNQVASRIEIRGLQGESGIFEHDGDIFALTSSGYVRIDPDTRTVVHRGFTDVRTEGNAQLLAVTEGWLWIEADRMDGGKGLVRVSLADDSVHPVEGVSGQPAGAADGNVWVVGEHEIISVDATTAEVVERYPSPAEAGALQVMTPGPIEGSVWAVGYDNPIDQPGLPETASLVRFDIEAGTFEVTPIVHTDGYLVGVAPVGDEAWASDFARGNVVRVGLDDIRPVMDHHRGRVGHGDRWASGDSASDDTPRIDTMTYDVDPTPPTDDHGRIGHGERWGSGPDAVSDTPRIDTMRSAIDTSTPDDHGRLGHGERWGSGVGAVDPR